MTVTGGGGVGVSFFLFFRAYLGRVSYWVKPSEVVVIPADIRIIHV